MTHFARKIYLTMMDLNDLLYHGQSDASTLDAGLLSSLAANELFEDARLLLWRNTDALVSNAQHGAPIVAAGFYPDRRPIGRIFHRVLQQIADHAPQRFPVGIDQKRPIDPRQLDL